MYRPLTAYMSKLRMGQHRNRAVHVSHKILFLFVVSVSLTALSAKEVVDKVVVTVNSEVILMSDIKKLQARVARPGAIDESLLLGEKLDTLKNNRAAQLQFLIREKLIAAEIKRQGLSIGNERVETEINVMAKRGQMNKPEFTTYLSKQGFSMEDYKDVLRNKLERQSFFESEIVSKLRITDEDAYGEYQTKNPNYAPNVNEFTIGQIFFDPRKGTPEAALARAKSAVEKLKGGEAFEVIANRESEDGSASKDGVLGTFKTGEFNPEIERAVSGLAVNDYTDVVRSKQGFHIFKLLSKKTTVDPQFLKYKESIKASLIEKNFSRQLKNWFESKKQDAYIKNFDNTL